jgi:hypothetical protein
VADGHDVDVEWAVVDHRRFALAKRRGRLPASEAIAPKLEEAEMERAKRLRERLM